MKTRRIISFALVLVMVTALMPLSVFSSTLPTYAAMSEGTVSLQSGFNTGSAATVWYGGDGSAWRVIGYDGEGVASETGTMTLLASGNMGLSYFNDGSNGHTNKYDGSTLKARVDGIAAGFSAVERSAISARTLKKGGYDGENTDCIAGDEDLEDQLLWPLSTKEACSLNETLRKADPEQPGGASSYWWLRSPGNDSNFAAGVYGDSFVDSRGKGVDVSLVAVRPAFRINLQSVLFTSAAEGGKESEGALSPVGSYTGSEWKLTLLDADRGGFTASYAGASGDVWTVKYSGAKSGDNEYISAVIVNSSGAVTYYGRLCKAEAGSDKTATVDLSGKMNEGDKLFVFNEQYNGDKKTDYASELKEIVKPAVPALSTDLSVFTDGFNTGSAATVWYGGDGSAWRVIGYDGEGVASEAGTMTLLASGNMGTASFDDGWNGYTNKYDGSTLKAKVDGIAAGFSAVEKSAISARALKKGGYDGKNTDCIAGDADLEDQLLWPLSTKEAYALNETLRQVDPEHPDWASSYWWLRSLGNRDHRAAVVYGNGDVDEEGISVNGNGYGVRPAFRIDLRSVLFTSAAEGGKSSGAAGADALTAVGNYAGSDWKLTLLDDGSDCAVGEGHKDFKAEFVYTDFDPNKWIIEYSGAKTGENEYISAIIKDSTGTVTYYGRLAQAQSGDNNTVTVDLAGKMNDGDKLYVFNEQYNGDKKTDYASSLQLIKYPTLLMVKVKEPAIYAGEDMVITVALYGPATGLVTVSVNGVDHEAEVRDGGASLTLSDLEPGEYYVVASYAGDDDYSKDQDTTHFTVHLPETVDVKGVAEWKDAGNESERPEKITVRLLANGNNTSITQEVSESGSGHWAFNFESSPSRDTDDTQILYSVAVDDIPNYTTAVEKVGFNSFRIVMTYHPPVAYAVTVTPGANMMIAAGADEQTVRAGDAMERVIYMASEGYYFPADYTVDSVNGVIVMWDHFTRITVFGTPTADANIVLTAPTAKTKEPTPNVVFTATGADTGTLTGVKAGMKYKIDDGEWQTADGASFDLTGLAPCTVTVYMPGDGTTTINSDEQTIAVTKAETPALTATHPDSVGGKGSIPTTAAHEISTDGVNWTACTGKTTGLAPDTYYVRVAAAGTVLTSEAQEIMIIAPGSINFSGRVTLNGRALTAGDVFTFEVYKNGTLIATAQSDATGDIYFTEIDYILSDVGQHTYIVRQGATKIPGVTIDEREYTVGVIISYNEGDAAITVTPSEEFSGLYFTNTYDKQTPPDYSVPAEVEAVYGQTLADVALPAGWAWDDPLTTPVGNAGDNTFSATYTPVDTTLYQTMSANLTISVSQAAPDCIAPEGLTVVYGQTLADVTLPDGWAWDDPLTTPVGNVGDNTFSATFTPEDTENYSAAAATLTITVTKAGTSSAALADDEKPKAVEGLIEEPFEQALVTAPEKLPEGYTGVEYSVDGENWSDKVPADKEAETYTVQVRYIGDDNHEDFAGDTITVTIVKAVYAFTLGEGEELSYTKESGMELTATVVQTGAEDTSFEHFAGVFVGETELQKDVDYAAKKGSTVVTVLPAALDKLAAGEYTLTVRFTNGEASTQLTVLAAGGGSTSPQTGGDSHVELWILLMTASAIAAASLFLTGRRKRIFGK
ncbi:MAG: Cna B-type domain-containing protein [Clostridia bacterium]|nr:Cna B-type domain-containing protein [Clostridia bacterium]